MLRFAEDVPSPGFQSLPQKLGYRVSAPSVDTILVVEDDRAVQRALKRLFEAEGYAVHAVSDGIAAVELFRGSPSSAVVLDLRLPGKLFIRSFWKICGTSARSKQWARATVCLRAW